MQPITRPDSSTPEPTSTSEEYDSPLIGVGSLKIKGIEILATSKEKDFSKREKIGEPNDRVEEVKSRVCSVIVPKTLEGRVL